MTILSDIEKKELSQTLMGHGITPSFHRLLILKEIRSRQDHPSADMLYQSLSPILPTLSRTTVYNTLGLFEEHELVSCLPVEGNEMRYDHDRQGSLHFYCLGCHAIIDPPVGIEPILPPDKMAGFQVKQVQTIVKGICSACQNKNNRNKSA